MLYRTRRFTVPALARAAAIRVVAIAQQIHRTGADTAYLDSLPVHHLSDLGLRRMEDRHFHETYYR
jgi:hypothetical protein